MKTWKLQTVPNYDLVDNEDVFTALLIDSRNSGPENSVTENCMFYCFCDVFPTWVCHFRIMPGVQEYFQNPHTNPTIPLHSSPTKYAFNQTSTSITTTLSMSLQVMIIFPPELYVHFSFYDPLSINNVGSCKKASVS